MGHVNRFVVVSALALAGLALGCGGTPAAQPDAGGVDGGGGMDGGGSDGGGGDGGAGCLLPNIPCHGTCIDPNADDMNCGACDHACGAGVGCAGGTCSCRAPMLACDGVCTNPQTDAANCGMCGNACPTGGSCIGGTCTSRCDAPNMICLNPIAGSDAGVSDAGALDDTGVAPADAGPVDAAVPTMPVCADLTSDPNNCGRCNVRCRGGSICSSGRCACPTGFTACMGMCVDTTTVDHCGSCSTSCGTGGTCESPDGGALQCTVCGPTRTRCGTDCADLATDAYNCGSCGHTCPLGETCAGNMCVCPGGHADCGAGCTDLAADPLHCGMCGNSCGPGGVCRSGACTCAAPYQLCGGTACISTDSDPNNCGSCGHVCSAPTQYCISGSCSSILLYHGWTPPPTLTGCSVTSYNAMAPTNMGGFYPYNTGDSNQCRMWKLAATVCTTAPVQYPTTGGTPNNNWTCPAAGGFTDPAFGTFCSVANQYTCTDCYGLCNAGTCSRGPMSSRNCAGTETIQM